MKKPIFRTKENGYRIKDLFQGDGFLIHPALQRNEFRKDAFAERLCGAEQMHTGQEKRN
jgi:hypothetical protein